MSMTQDDHNSTQPRKQRGHTLPRIPLIGLDHVGWLHVGNLLALLGVSHSTLYAGLKTNRYPAPDSRDGKRPVWKTGTIKAFLDA